MVWQIVKKILSEIGGFVVYGISFLWETWRIRKKFESYFSNKHEDYDPFLLSRIISENDYFSQNIDVFTKHYLIDSICSGFNEIRRHYLDENNLNYSVMTLNAGIQEIHLDVAMGTVNRLKALFEQLDRFDPSDVTKNTDVCENFLNWKQNVKQEFFKKIDDLMQQARLIQAERLDLTDHLDAFTDRLDDAEIDELIQGNQGKIVNLYRAMSDAFQRNELVELQRLAAVPKDVNRINQIETIIDLYTLKMRRVNEDESLSEEEREMKLASWQALMEADIQALGGAH